MIINFLSKSAEDIYNGVNSRYSRKLSKELHARAQRFFDQIQAATYIETLRIPPSNHLEKLKGNLSNYWSLRINHQWKIIFQWVEGDAYNVNIVDYH